MARVSVFLGMAGIWVATMWALRSNHWVEGSRPKGLIPLWRPCVDHGPIHLSFGHSSIGHSSIGACHNIGSCGQLISAGMVKQAFHCASPITPH
jgi:hypothetical protein